MGEGGGDGLGARRRRDVGRDAVEGRVRGGGAELVEHGVDPRGVAAVDRRRRAGGGQAGGDHAADALGRAADEGRAAGEVDLHAPMG